MKIVFAPDKFKNSLSAAEVCGILQSAFSAVMPDAEYVCCPMADGGEGFAACIANNTPSVPVRVQVRNVEMSPVNAQYSFLAESDTAVFDSAAAVGMNLVPGFRTDQLRASSYGVGQIIAHAVSHGARRIVVGLGGSACTDAGTGMAQALGFTFRDADGRILLPGQTLLSQVRSIDSSAVPDSLKDVAFTAAADVANPLTGPNGTSFVYAPQKGADDTTVTILEESMLRLKDIWAESGFWSAPEEPPGFGAAGGLGAAMRIYLNADLTSGAGVLIRMNNFTGLIAGADYVVTGEGMTDSQTMFGKTCLQVAETARRAHVPALLLSGALSAPADFLGAHFAAAFGTVSPETPEPDKLANAAHNLYQAALHLAQLIQGGNLVS